MIFKFLPLATVLALSGCASMLPYEDTFDCPQIERGQCVSVPTAHEYALNMQAGEPASGEKGQAGLNSAMDAYRRAVTQGKAEEIEQRQAQLLRLISPAQTEAFAEALSEYKAAIKKGEADLVAEAENRLRTLHAAAIAEAQNQSQQEALLKRTATRQEFLGAYAQGARAEAVLVPPVLMEAYILPYQTDFGTLASERTLWITVEDAVWTWPATFKDRKEKIGTTVRGR